MLPTRLLDDYILSELSNTGPLGQASAVLKVGFSIEWGAVYGSEPCSEPCHRSVRPCHHRTC
ncbi:unnamed protein product [Choristocarpus tenellus]